MEKRKRPPKAYRDNNFLNSNNARTIRILAEYHEPLARFQKSGITDSVVFFGSARSYDTETARQKIKKNSIVGEKAHYILKMAFYYEEAVALSRKLTEWSMKPNTGKQSFYVCSGGGPGMMEAANKGAYLAGGKSIGLNISIPTEQYPNSFISEELMFEFHYFFIRKFWFVYLAKALVIFPGGFGTMDELMEVITLLQTQKIKRRLPIVIFGKEYWDQVLNLDTMVRWGTIEKKELDLLFFSDDVNETFEYLKNNIHLTNGLGV